MALSPGGMLSHYRLVEKIGEGGMGIVYRAHDNRLERDVALKALPAGLLSDEAARKRFRKEALALSKLNHPNIATVYDFDTQDGVDFLVMEYIPGTTLDKKVAAGPLSEKEVVRLGAQLVEGLTAAHHEGVLHRDLKPGNLRVTRDGRLKILDFGLAKLLRPVEERSQAETATETRRIVGTLPYMAPEQLRAGNVDERVDLYAAGVILYELATGRRPFQEKLSTALTDDILHKPPPPPGRLNPEISTRLEEVVLKCLEKDPDNRYQSAKEIAVDLRRLSATGEVVIPSSAPPRPRRWLHVAIGVIVLAVAAVVAYRPLNPPVQPTPKPAEGKVMLAVLPFDNLSADPEQQYFVHGMHEALIAGLSKIGALRVISRRSVMRYRGTDKSLPEIARELGVDVIVEGSVLRAGDQVRITAQLIDATTDTHLWAENYARSLRDVLQLQSEVARAIAQQVKAVITAEEDSRIGGSGPIDLEAYEAYLKGRYYWNQRTKDGLRKAIEYFESAIERQPNYALAYAALAEAYIVLGDYGFLSTARAESLVRSASVKAIELDDNLAEPSVPTWLRHLPLRV